MTETKKELIELLGQGLLGLFTNAPCVKKLVITSQRECPVQMHHGIKALCHGMSTIHEVTDIIILQQVIIAIEERATWVKVISDDTDVFVLLLQLYIEQSLITTIFLEGAGSNRNVIDIEKTAEKQQDVVPSLLAAHTLSGCDSMLDLYGLGKKSLCFLLQNYMLLYFRETSADTSDVIQERNIFIAPHYDITSATDMSEIRCALKNVSRYIKSVS